jgi:hypothetical protein
MHLQSLGSQANLRQKILDVSYPALGSQITFQVMAVALQSTCHQDAVRSLFEGLQNVKGVELPGTGQPDDLDVRRVLDAQGAGQVSGRICAVVTAEGDNLWLEVVHLSFSSGLQLSGEQGLRFRSHLFVSIVH